MALRAFGRRHADRLRTAVEAVEIFDARSGIENDNVFATVDLDGPEVSSATKKRASFTARGREGRVEWAVFLSWFR
jgi:hypothetical protein